ncbi:MAG: protein kinase [Verrucomicrobia bacterium]|nr:protein kinase [Verrucomicrobiota bacterium]MDA1087188.1 protein kinase [Verrucomicrobiota bacterium]
MSDEPDIDIIYDRIPAISCNACGDAIDVSNHEPLTQVECPHCNAEQTIPARFGKFLLTSTLGKGGMGAVYLAYDELLNRFVAIKVLLASFGDDPDFVRSFQTEAQAAAALNHPSIVQIYSFGQENGQPYIVMELVSGGKFSDIIEEQKQVAPPLVMRIGRDIASALEAAANAGLLHGDVKPENILLDDRGTAKLVDFGLASTIGMQDSGGIWGTPNYIAPEKVRRQKVDARSDIYSLGATLFHALSGRPPFEGEDAIEVVKARLTGPAVDIEEIVPGLNKDIASLINRMLEAEPFRRFPNYSSLRADMDKALIAVGGGSKRHPGKFKPKVTIRKRGKFATPQDVPSPTTNEAPSGPASSSGRRGGKLIVTKGSGPRRMASEGHDDSTPGERAPGRGPGTVRRRRRRGSRIAALIVIGIIAIIGAVLGFLVVSGARADKKIRRTHKLAISVIAAAVDGRASVDVPETVSALQDSVVKARHAYSNVNSLAALFIGPATRTRLAVSAAPPEPEPASADAKPEEASGPVQGSAGGAPAPGDPAPAPGDDAQPADAAQVAAGAPPQGAPAEGVDAPNGERADAEADAEPQPAAPEEPPPELAAFADTDVVTALYTNSVATYVLFSRAGTALQAMASSLSELSIAISKTGSVANASTDTEFVSEKLKEITASQTAFDDRLQRFQASASDAIAMVGSLEKDEKALDGIRADAQKTSNAQQAEQDRIAEQERLAEQALRESEDLAERALAERQSIRRSSAAFTTQIRANRFAQALRDSKRTLKGFTTDAAKAEADTLIERYQLLVDLRDFLIAAMQENECRWCWQGSADIIGATTHGIRIRTQEDPIPWESIKPGQFLSIAEKYLELARGKTKRIERARHQLALAAYVVELGAPERAVKYTEKALELWDRGTFPDDAKRLAEPLENLDSKGEEEEEAPF